MSQSRRLCVAVDIEDYSRRSVTDQRTMQIALRHVLDEVWSGIDADRQPNGDGEVALVPGGADEAAVLAHVLTTLQSTCHAAHLRIRAAAHAGHAAVGANGFVGHAVVRTCRMLHTAALRRALAADPAPFGVALLVSESLFEDVVALEGSGLVAEEFSPVHVRDVRKRFFARAFLRSTTPRSTGCTWTNVLPEFGIAAGAGARVNAVVPSLRGARFPAGAAMRGVNTWAIDAAATFSLRIRPRHGRDADDTESLIE